MTAEHNHPPICCCPVREISEGHSQPAPGHACPGCPEHGTFADVDGIVCPQCKTPIGRPHTDYCTLAPGKVWDGVLPAATLIMYVDQTEQTDHVRPYLAEQAGRAARGMPHERGPWCQRFNCTTHLA